MIMSKMLKIWFSKNILLFFYYSKKSEFINIKNNMQIFKINKDNNLI